MSPAKRVTVYVAKTAFVGAGADPADPRTGFVVKHQQIVTLTHPAVARHPTMWTLAGTVDESDARRIELLGDEAKLTQFIDAIAPAGLDAPPRRPRRTGGVIGRPRGSRRFTIEQIKAKFNEFQDHNDGRPPTRLQLASIDELDCAESTIDETLADAEPGLTWSEFRRRNTRKT